MQVISKMAYLNNQSHVASPKKAVLNRISAFLGGALLCFAASIQAQNGPEIALDATSLVNDIKATRTVAVDVESSLDSALKGVEAQTIALKEAGCEPGNESAACQKLKKSLKKDYLVVLDGVEQRLPALRSAVQSVVENIEVRMGQQAGSTAKSVQDELANNLKPGKSRKPSLQGISGSRLSESLSNMQKLVSMAGSGASVQTIQADLYLDMRESLKLIDNLKADIQRTRILAELQLEDLRVDDEKVEIAREAQEYLFGEQTSAPLGGAPDMPSTSEPVNDADYLSPLEM